MSILGFTFTQWGIVLNCVGIIAGIFQPKQAGRWAGPETDRIERRMAIRYYIAVVLVLAGTILQLIDTFR